MLINEMITARMYTTAANANIAAPGCRLTCAESIFILVSILLTLPLKLKTRHCDSRSDTFGTDLVTLRRYTDLLQ